MFIDDLNCFCQDAVLVADRKGLGLISVKDGILLASHSLPCQPLSPVVHGDFSNDGLMDFVVHCRSRYVHSMNLFILV